VEAGCNGVDFCQLANNRLKAVKERR